MFYVKEKVVPCTWASLVAQTVKNPLAMRETWVQSLAWEDPLEKSMATHSSILAWRIPMERWAWWATVHGVAKSWTWLSNCARKHYTKSLICISSFNPYQTALWGENTIIIPVSQMRKRRHRAIEWLTQIVMQLISSRLDFVPGTWPNYHVTMVPLSGDSMTQDSAGRKW